MTDELKPVRCGCGGEAVLCESDKYDSFDFTYMIYCKACGISSDVYDTEAEAITAWNRAIGAKDINVPNKFATDTNVGNKTAKVVTEEKPIEGSDNYIAVTCCGECGNVVSLFDRYCSGCGCRLEWK